MSARPFDPLTPGAHGLGETCRLCGAPLLLGQRPSLVVDADGYARADMADDAARMRAGRAHNAVAAIVHWDCVVAFGLESS